MIATGHSPTRHPRHPIAAGFLLVLLIVGGPVLWIGVPLAGMWLAGEIADNLQQHGTLAILMTIVGMMSFATLLAWINRLYLRFTKGFAPSGRAPRVQGPLEAILVASFVVALAVLIFWFFVLAENPPYVTFGGGSYQ